jgi:homocysteine S-methyltransferase
LGSPFNIGAALNVNVRHFDNQLQRAQKKIANGVNMFLTQPVLSPAAVENIITARRELKARILGGIMPIVSYKNACFMNNEIAGITVDDEIVEMYRDLSKEDAAELAVELSVKMAARIAPYVDGYYLITPFKRIDIILEIIKGIRDLP